MAHFRTAVVERRSAARERAGAGPPARSPSGGRNGRRSRPGSASAGGCSPRSTGEVQRLIAAQQAAAAARAASAAQQQAADAQTQTAAGVRRRPPIGATAVTPEGAAVAPAPGHSGVVGVALQYLGTPYVWAGASPGGFDCSGLVMYAYAQVGVSLPHSSYAMWDEGVAVPQGPARAGRHRLLRRARARRDLHRRRRVRPRAAHRDGRAGLEPRSGLLRGLLRRGEAHRLASREAAPANRAVCTRPRRGRPGRRTRAAQERV